ncbi:MAG: hypothetical protein JWN48_2793 [Myxococcaceae bacterium]|nr:hypothetical protein [Myxococcaceae bacterium]
MSRSTVGGCVARARSLWIAYALWCCVFLVPAVQLLRGRSHAIPYGVYVTAGAHWLARAPLYDLSNIDGFQYFPQAALIFSPLPWLGSPLGDLLFRALGWSTYAWGMFRLARKLNPQNSELAFMLATLLAVGPAVANLVNGQANLLVAALVLHVNAALIERRWWQVSALLAFGIALKPLMVVPLLLTAALYRPTRWRLVSTLMLVIAVPWLFRDHTYVLAQYRGCLAKLRLCADPDRLFEDLRGLLASVGVSLTARTYTGLRMLAALGVLGFGRWTCARLDEPRAAIVICALSGSYLMLFNPRTLSSSYVLPGAFVALLAAESALTRRWKPTVALVSIAVAWSVNHHVVPWVEYWLRPLACAGFLFFLGDYVLRSWREARTATA